MLQLEMFLTTQITLHVRQPDRSWQVYEVNDIQGYINTDAINSLYKYAKELFPNQRTFIQIQNV